MMDYTCNLMLVMEFCRGHENRFFFKLRLISLSCRFGGLRLIVSLLWLTVSPQKAYHEYATVTFTVMCKIHILNYNHLMASHRTTHGEP